MGIFRPIKSLLHPGNFLFTDPNALVPYLDDPRLLPDKRLDSNPFAGMGILYGVFWR